MQQVQGYTRSHWIPPFGNCWLCIAQAATRVAGKMTTMKKCANFAGILIAVVVCGNNTKCFPNGGVSWLS
jgi:hypothetical protein